MVKKEGNGEMGEMRIIGNGEEGRNGEMGKKEMGVKGNGEGRKWGNGSEVRY